ncbi:Spy/CpxP family protein refolding chaperone [Methylomonas sp. AM2-LC]|uniref:Spy/CpxP family protein refolding chaperone n=1 Tax=Methylomonas sp. AM2-LC TaxID=3153301 RepID=UPI003263733F
MKVSGNNVLNVSKHLILSVAMATSLLFVPGLSLAVDKDAHEDQTELRIKDMHTKLKITAEQEAQWSKVTQVMLEEAKNMDSLTQTRIEQAKNMTAIDDLKSYAEIAEAHTNGIKKLIPAFAELYSGMSDTQKKEADLLFREGFSKQKHKKAHKEAAGN